MHLLPQDPAIRLISNFLIAGFFITSTIRSFLLIFPVWQPSNGLFVVKNPRKPPDVLLASVSAPFTAWKLRPPFNYPEHSCQSTAAWVAKVPLPKLWVFLTDPTFSPTAFCVHVSASPFLTTEYHFLSFWPWNYQPGIVRLAAFHSV